MGRRFSGKKGKHGSKKPVNKVIPSWMVYKPKEIEKLIVKTAKAGKSSSAIGLYLRDTYGIPLVKTAAGKRIGQILVDNKVEKELPDDLLALIRNYLKLKKHYLANKQDKTAWKGMANTQSGINRLMKYYKREGKLPQDWTFDPERAKMLAE